MVGTTFQLRPDAIDDRGGAFKWTGQYYHLTYSSFIPKDDLLGAVARATRTPLEGWSYAHEDTSDDPSFVAGDTGYQHTHFALMFKARLGLSGSRKFAVACDLAGNSADTAAIEHVTAAAAEHAYVHEPLYRTHPRASAALSARSAARELYCVMVCAALVQLAACLQTASKRTCVYEYLCLSIV
jgi:hypothetical protein